jgi:hypothetical protein
VTLDCSEWRNAGGVDKAVHHCVFIYNSDMILHDEGHLVRSLDTTLTSRGVICWELERYDVV